MLPSPPPLAAPPAALARHAASHRHAMLAAAHGTFHAATLPDGDLQITAVIDEGR